MVYKNYLTQELPSVLAKLKAVQKPNFGMMTAHHMVEHLIYVTKSMMKVIGTPDQEMNKSQKYFRHFIDAGCPFEHKPKINAQLNDLRLPSIEKAIEILNKITIEFYGLFETDPSFKCYNALTGALSLDDIELFHYQHAQWHTFQFGLVDNFNAVAV